MPSNLYPGIYRGAHNKAANEALNLMMSQDEEFANIMTEMGVSIPKSPTGSILGRSPSGWVWHHDIEPGLMQLVPTAQHSVGSQFWLTLHPNGVGGYSIWGR